MGKQKISILIYLLILSSLSGCSLEPRSFVQTNYKTTESTLATTTETNVNEVNIDLTAYNFFYSNPEITVHKDNKVTITLTSADGQHDISINDFSIQSTVADINNKTKISFVADKTGEFEFYSSIGNQKDLGLVGKLIVLP